jgi:8-oxo-dGTP pyrophosphatase MutT (NUDIX family)
MPQLPLKPLAAAIIPRGSRVLLTERRAHEHGEVWSWPSGKVEDGESPEQAILRELQEELLLDHAQVVGRLGDIDLASGYRMTHFHVTIPAHTEPVLNDRRTLVQFQWMTKEEAQRAFATLDTTVAKRALDFIDQVLTRAFHLREPHSDKAL